jgi:hypothetical protein
MASTDRNLFIPFIVILTIILSIPTIVIRRSTEHCHKNYLTNTIADTSMREHVQAVAVTVASLAFCVLFLKKMSSVERRKHDKKVYLSVYRLAYVCVCVYVCVCACVCRHAILCGSMSVQV